MPPPPPSADSDTSSEASTEPGDDARSDTTEYDVTRATVDEIMKAMVVTVAEDDHADAPPGPAVPTQPDTFTPKIPSGDGAAGVVAPATLGDHTTPHDDDEPATRPAGRGKKDEKDKKEGPGEAHAPAPTA